MYERTIEAGTTPEGFKQKYIEGYHDGIKI